MLSKKNIQIYLKVSAAVRVGVDSHEDKNTAWPQCQMRKSDTGPGLQDREPASLDTSGL